MQVHVARAELWTLPVDAIVNPANSLGIMGGGIGGTLRRQGGDAIQQARRCEDEGTGAHRSHPPTGSGSKRDRAKRGFALAGRASASASRDNQRVNAAMSCRAQ